MLFQEDDYSVDLDIRLTKMLPARAFVGKEVLREEAKRIFEKMWLLVPQRTKEALAKDPRSLEEVLEKPDSHDAFELLGKQYLLKRDAGGVLRCLSNVCTHWGSQIVTGLDTRDGLECRLHGRQYNSCGKFVSHGPLREGSDLKEFSVVRYGPFFFFCQGEPKDPLSWYLDPIKRFLGNLPLANFKRVGRTEETQKVGANWKHCAMLELDRFHIPWIHAQTFQRAITSYHVCALPPDAFLQWAHARDSKQTIPREHLPASIAATEGENPIFGAWLFLLPNLSFSLYNGLLSVTEYLPVPGNPDQTLVVWYHYTNDEEKYWKNAEFHQQVSAEDLDALKYLSAGVRSGLYKRGSLLPEEEGVHWFLRWWNEKMFDAK